MAHSGRSRRIVASAIVGVLLSLEALAVDFEEPPSLVLSWGRSGSGDGEFLYPRGIATDADGNVYVAEESGDRIQKFDSEGNFLAKWGSHGSGDGQFSLPTSIATDAEGRVYVADYYNNRIQKFDGEGNFLAKWGSAGTGDGQFAGPWSLATDADGNVYVSDGDNHRIQKFDRDGNFLTQWGSYGSGDGQLRFPHGVATDAGGNVYVADGNNHRIQKFDSVGNFLAKWGSSGTGEGQFRYPAGLATDANGNVYVADDNNHRIQKFDGEGSFLTQWGSYGSGDGQFNVPLGVATDVSGDVYVADSRNNRVVKFRPSRRFTTRYPVAGSAVLITGRWGGCAKVKKQDGQKFLEGHLGEDYGVVREAVYAFADGNVCEVGTDGGYGKYVLIEHDVPGLQKIHSLYAHLDSVLAGVEAGARVAAGTQIGVSGKSGPEGTPYHLHFELFEGRACSLGSARGYLGVHFAETVETVRDEQRDGRVYHNPATFIAKFAVEALPARDYSKHKEECPKK